ncbi:hypothetical protein Cgig2_014381 [Carnegiea gigantea]|uniref:Uncharacterized protein n=1 Tax=Carnegiea gigantea TaxID=171969 RepID=A0A9Q1GXH8_9CARY|nr:hypothetical protein Cgig2_014381 [Carnegiea gigantea]
MKIKDYVDAPWPPKPRPKNKNKDKCCTFYKDYEHGIEYYWNLDTMLHDLASLGLSNGILKASLRTSDKMNLGVKQETMGAPTKESCEGPRPMLGLYIDPTVIKLIVANHRIRRALLDTGSSTNVIPLLNSLRAILSAYYMETCYMTDDGSLEKWW